MKPKVVLGLDAAQAGVCFHLTDLAGQCLARGKVAKSQAGWTELQQALAGQHVTPADCLVAIEATGDHHLPWCEALTAAGATVLALNPLVARRTTPVANAIRDHKSDPIDAAGLACTAGREGAALTRFTYRSAPALAGLRKLVAAQRAVRTALTNLMKHAGALQELVFPEAAGLKLSALRLRRLLLAAPTPTLIAALPEPALTRLVGAHAPAVRAAARTSFAPAALVAACTPALQTLLRIVDQLTDALRALDQQVLVHAAAAVSSDRLALVQTLPGFGQKTAPVLLAFIPADLITRDLSRKRKVASLQALFGIDPRRRESGRWTGRVKLSKRGIRPARTALFQIAFCSVIHDPEMHAYYTRLTHVLKKPHKVALFDLARKHLRRLVAVLTSGQPFQPKPLPLLA